MPFFRYIVKNRVTLTILLGYFKSQIITLTWLPLFLCSKECAMAKRTKENFYFLLPMWTVCPVGTCCMIHWFLCNHNGWDRHQSNIDQIARAPLSNKHLWNEKKVFLTNIHLGSKASKCNLYTVVFSKNVGYAREEW